MKRIVLLCCVLTACSPDPTDPMPIATSSTGRVKVERIGVFKDDVAYHDRRGIYIITDTKTGTEYIGVSGVGITETGSHYQSTGKSGYNRPDER